MIEKPQANKPFILFAVAFGLTIIGLGMTIGTAVIHFLNNHFAIFSQDNILLIYAWVSVSSIICSSTFLNKIRFSCQKLRFN
jgi:hypothetical protein